METSVIKVSRENFHECDLISAATAIQNGELVAFPTETVYGLGANALDSEACDRIFAAKGRPRDNPLIVHILNPEDAYLYAEADREPLFQKLAERFMPGPLTIILKKTEIIPDSVTVGLDTVALRCPSHPVARALIQLSQRPIAAPSANRSGRPSPTTAEHVVEDMNGRIPFIIDSGACDVGLESTVISLKDGVIHLLRPGFVTLDDLRTVTENVVVSSAVLSKLNDGERAESPGMKYRHYAPEASVTMVNGTEEKVLDFFRTKLSQGCGILCFEEDVPVISDAGDRSHIVTFGSMNDLLSQAQSLFDSLRKFDSLNVKKIYARYTKHDDLGLAISNRLLRACAFDLLELR